MTQTTDSQSPEQLPDDSGEIRELIRSAGRRLEPPADMEQRIRRALGADWRRYARRRRSLRRLRYLAAAAAVTLLALGIYRGWRGGGREAVDAGEPVAAVLAAFGQVRIAEPGSPATVPLSDRVELGRGASVRTMSDAGLTLELRGVATVRIDQATEARLDSRSALWLERGRVYVDSTVGPDPISIQTRVGSLDDLGTRFEVSLSGSTLRVRVRDGQVRVRNRAGAIEIGRGEAAQIEAAAAPSRSVAPPYGPTWGWLRRFTAPPAGGSVSVRGLVAWYAAEEGYRVRYDSAESARGAAEVAVHGDVAALPRDRLLELALAATTFQVRFEGDVIVVERRARAAAED